MADKLIAKTSIPVTDSGYTQVIIDCEACQTIEGFFDECSRKLHLPVNSANNPGAFTDMLEDYEDYADEPGNLELVFK